MSKYKIFGIYELYTKLIYIFILTIFYSTNFIINVTKSTG